jgi:hypothetical protein
MGMLLTITIPGSEERTVALIQELVTQRRVQVAGPKFQPLSRQRHRHLHPPRGAASKDEPVKTMRVVPRPGLRSTCSGCPKVLYS